MIMARVLFFGLSLFLLIPIESMGNMLPESIGAFRLQNMKSGAEAKKEIARLHGKNLDFRTGYIGTYKHGHKEAMLWISDYDTKAKAAKEVEKMARRIQTREGKEFRHFRMIAIKEMPVYFVVGMGQAHYFYQTENKVIWLAVDPQLAEETIRDLIEKGP
jgi:hypothetical protein